MSTYRLLAMMLTALLLLAGCTTTDLDLGGSATEETETEESPTPADEAGQAEPSEAEPTEAEATEPEDAGAEPAEPTEVAGQDGDILAEAESDVVDGEPSEGLALPADVELPDVEVNEEFCAEVGGILDTVAGSGESPEQLEASFAAIDEAFAAAIDVAPADALDTLEGSRAFFAGVNDAAAAVDYDDSLVDDTVFEALEAQYGDQIEDMETYFAACQLDF